MREFTQERLLLAERKDRVVRVTRGSLAAAVGNVRIAKAAAAAVTRESILEVKLGGQSWKKLLDLLGP